MKKIFVAALLTLFALSFVTLPESTPSFVKDVTAGFWAVVLPRAYADEGIAIHLAFVFFKDAIGKEKSIIIGSDNLEGCQEAFKAMLSGIGGDTTDFSVAGCKSYLLNQLPKS